MTNKNIRTLLKKQRIEFTEEEYPEELEKVDLQGLICLTRKGTIFDPNHKLNYDKIKLLELYGWRVSSPQTTQELIEILNNGLS